MDKLVDLALISRYCKNFLLHFIPCAIPQTLGIGSIRNGRNLAQAPAEHPVHIQVNNKNQLFPGKTICRHINVSTYAVNEKPQVSSDLAVVADVLRQLFQ